MDGRMYCRRQVTGGLSIYFQTQMYDWWYVVYSIHPIIRKFYAYKTPTTFSETEVWMLYEALRMYCVQIVLQK